MKRVGLLVFLLLSGCGAYDVREARTPLTSPIIGMTFPDLANCMGPWDSVHQTKPDEAILTWKHVANTDAFKASITLVGSVSIGGGGGCIANATILRDGTVADLAFPQSYSNSLFSAPYAACEPLVKECLGHGGSTGLPAGYDAFAYLLPDAVKKR